MPRFPEFAASPPLASAIWLEVRDGQRLHLFEFRAGDDRAIVVGADIRAHLRVDRPGVAPMEFHFERDGAEVYVAPGYRAALRVDGRPVRGRTRLPGAALIEVQSVALDVRVLYEKPADSAETLDERETAQHVRSYRLEDALDANTVRVSVPGLNQLPALGSDTLELDTTVFERAARTTTLPLHEPAAFERTLVIERGAPEGSAAPEAEPAALERTLALPQPACPPPVTEPAFFETRAFGTMLTSAEISAPAAPVHAEAEGPTSVSLSLDEATTTFETLRADSPPAPPLKAESKPAVPASNASLVARFGLLVKARPLAVITSALCAALLTGIGLASVPTTPWSASARLVAASSATPSPPRSSVSTPTVRVEAPQPSGSLPTVVAPAMAAGEPSKSRRRPPADPELAQAVAHLSAGRYADASIAYRRLAARPQAEAFQVLAVLLERASLADCRPSADRKPACPEVLR